MNEIVDEPVESIPMTARELITFLLQEVDDLDIPMIVHMPGFGPCPITYDDMEVIMDPKGKAEDVVLISPLSMQLEEMDRQKLNKCYDEYVLQGGKKIRSEFDLSVDLIFESIGNASQSQIDKASKKLLKTLNCDNAELELLKSVLGFGNNKT
jgi:hypothetical protein